MAYFFGKKMDFQFYPTGVHTAYKMYRKFKSKIAHLCDPSAGKGHLFKHLLNDFEGLPEEVFKKEIEELISVYEIGEKQAARIARSIPRERDISMSAVEIDFRHHANIRELGVHIIGHDFMAVQSMATVSHVIMNPPFNRGVEHVLHAYDKLYSAELVAIINSESIKNPCTEARKRLVDLIEKFGSVEFLQEEFVNEVERKTNVEIALIHLKKTPVSFVDTDKVFEGLKKGDNQYQELEAEYMSALALPNNFIDNTVHHFNIAVEAARISAEAQAVALRAEGSLGLSLQEMQAKGVGSEFRPDTSDIGDNARNIYAVKYCDLKKRAWSQIIRSSCITDKLSNQARRKLESKAEEIYQLEFTIPNIHGFIRGLIESMGDIYREMICDMFDNIIGRSNDNVVFYKSYKSNLKHRNVGMRIKNKRFIIPNINSSWGGSLTYESEMFLKDLDKICYYLNGETYANQNDGVVEAFRKNLVVSGERISTRFFDIRHYKNSRTLHFYPNDSKIIDSLNLFVGKVRQWIPTDYDKVNDDFKKQYENAEKYHDEYMDAWSKNPNNRYRSPIFSMTTTRSDVDTENDIENMGKAIEMVHLNHGLKPGLAIADQSEGQLLLLAA